MKLSIYSLKNVLYEGEAKSVNCRTLAGEITILDHHRPLISMLRGGVVKIVDGNRKEKFVNIESGFIEVNTNNQARFLVNEA